jgi:hypothetical protein
VADDGHTINVGPVTIGEPLPKATEVDRLRAENEALRELVRRFYTQAWETPLTVEQDELLDRVLLGKDGR